MGADVGDDGADRPARPAVCGERRQRRVQRDLPVPRHLLRWTPKGSSQQPDLNPLKFRPHGIDVTLRPDGRTELYVVNHGGNESVEVFEVDLDESRPTLKWVGGVRAPGHRRRQRRRRGRRRFRRQHHRRPRWPHRGQRRGGDGRSRYGWCAGMVPRPRLGHVARHADQHGQRRRGIARRSVVVHRRLELALPAGRFDAAAPTCRRHHCAASTSWSTT